MSEKSDRTSKYLFTLLRLGVGWIFLFAFLDKNFGWFQVSYRGETFGTSPDAAWNFGVGQSPTWGFLQFGTEGKLFQDLFQPLAESVVVEWFFMVGLLLIGLTMILGIFRKIAAVSGAIFMILLWLASLPLVHNPFMDDHLVNALVLLILGFTDNYGIRFIPQWENVADKYPILD